MKKFFSILCAFAVVFSASAASRLDKKVAYNEKSFEVNVKRGAKPAKTVRANADFKSFNPTTKSAVKTLNTVARAKKEAIHLSFSSFDDAVQVKDVCATQGWWQVIAQNDSLAVSLSNNNREEAAGEYAWEDLDPDYCFIQSLETGAKIYFTDGGCSVTSADGDYSFMGLFQGEDGNTYNITILYVAPVMPQGGDFEIVECLSTVYPSLGDEWFRLYDADENVFRFDILFGEGNNGAVSGVTYTLDEMDASYSYATVLGEKIEYVTASFTKTVAEDESFEIVASFTDADGNVWNIHYGQGAPVQRELTLAAEGAVDLSATAAYATAYNADTTAFAALYVFLGEDGFAGQFTQEDLFSWYSFIALKEGASWTYFDVDSALLNVTFNEAENIYTVAGDLFTISESDPTDLALFHLTLTLAGPEPIEVNRQEELTVAGLKLGVYGTAWQLYGYNEDETKYVSIAAYTDVVAGHYTEEDLAADYCYIVTDITEEGYNFFELYTADLDVTFDEATGAIAIEGKFVGVDGDDVPEFTLHLTGAIPTPVVSDMTFAFSTSEDGITVTPSNDEDAWDWLIVSEEVFEYYGADEIADIIYSNYGDEYAVTGEQLLALEEEIAWYCTDEETEEWVEGTYYLVVWGAGEDNVTTDAASFQFAIPFEVQGIENVTLTEDAKKVVVDGVLYIVRDNKMFNIQGAQVR